MPNRLCQFAALFAFLFITAMSHSTNAQLSEYYLMAGDQSTFHVIQNGTLLRSWGLANGTDQYQYPIVVLDSIRSMGANGSDVGAEYDFNGNDLGNRYTNPRPSTSRGWDGATDGTNNYSIDTAGIVTLFDLDWSNPVDLFDAGGLGGITYDPNNDSLWVSQFSSSTITQYAMDGSILSSFDAGHSQNMALAMDYSDGTLWIHNRNVEGTYEQWSTAGVMLDSIAVAGMSDQNALGGEFRFPTSIPEPSTMLPCIAFAFWVNTRRRR